MQFIHTMLYGLIGGFAEFFPISSEAHRFVYGYLTGFSQVSPFVKLMLYFGALVAILVTCWERLAQDLIQRIFDFFTVVAKGCILLVQNRGCNIFNRIGKVVVIILLP